MRRTMYLLGLAAFCGALVVGVPAMASAKVGTTTCDGTLASGTYKKVIVPENAVCFVETPVRIRTGLTIESGATFVLGDESLPGDNGVIDGGVHATGAMNVQIHFVSIKGGVHISGGSGPFGGPFDVTWNTIEDSVINGAVNINGYNGLWQGFFGTPSTARSTSTTTSSWIRTATKSRRTRSAAA